MMATTDKPTTTADRELVLNRIIDAPREKVFKAWTDPALIKQWFAPLPWTTPVAETDVRRQDQLHCPCAPLERRRSRSA